jgi:hypothetical protein
MGMDCRRPEYVTRIRNVVRVERLGRIADSKLRIEAGVRQMARYEELIDLSELYI